MTLGRVLVLIYHTKKQEELNACLLIFLATEGFENMYL